MKETYFKPFGPTIGKYNLSHTMIGKVNSFANKIIKNKRLNG